MKSMSGQIKKSNVVKTVDIVGTIVSILSGLMLNLIKFKIMHI